MQQCKIMKYTAKFFEFYRNENLQYSNILWLNYGWGGGGGVGADEFLKHSHNHSTTENITAMHKLMIRA
jgi:hypothetical protein